jgi:hypothetical protein
LEVSVLSVRTRRQLLPVAVLAALLAAVLLTMSLRPAGAQVATEVFLSHGSITLSNGHGNLGPGTGSQDGIFEAQCSGRDPRGGPNMPVDVVTELTTTTVLLRILNQSATGITGTVTINCTFQAEALQAATVKAVVDRALR